MLAYKELRHSCPSRGDDKQSNSNSTLRSWHIDTRLLGGNERLRALQSSKADSTTWQLLLFFLAYPQFSPLDDSIKPFFCILAVGKHLWNQLRCSGDLLLCARRQLTALCIYWHQQNGASRRRRRAPVTSPSRCCEGPWIQARSSCFSALFRLDKTRQQQPWDGNTSDCALEQLWCLALMSLQHLYCFLQFCLPLCLKATRLLRSPRDLRCRFKDRSSSSRAQAPANVA